MSTLAPSLRLLFTELDVRWPHRDRRTDGWARNCRYVGPNSSDHCYDSAGRVHAIDIDRDGIDAEYVFRHLMNSALPTQYVIYNRRIANRSVGNWRIRPYTGTSNPHTDHIHVSIVHANWARNYDRGWGIVPRRGGIIGPTVPDIPADSSVAETPWDYAPAVNSTASVFFGMQIAATAVAVATRSLRR